MPVVNGLYARVKFPRFRLRASSAPVPCCLSRPEWAGMGSQVASLESMQNFGGYFAGSLAPVITGWIVQTTYSYVNALLASAVVAAVAYIALVGDPLPGAKLVGASHDIP